MSRGYPDFFGVPLFPKWGPIYYDSALGTVLPATTEVIVHVTSPIVTYGGYLYLTGVDDPSHARLGVSVDNIWGLNETLDDLLKMGFTGPDSTPAYLTHYDIDAGFYTIMFSRGYSVSTLYDIDITNDGLANFDFNGIAWYASIRA